MAVFKEGYRGLELLVQLNLDRVFVGLAMGGALYLAAYLISVSVAPQYGSAPPHRICPSLILTPSENPSNPFAR